MADTRGVGQRKVAASGFGGNTPIEAEDSEWRDFSTTLEMINRALRLVEGKFARFNSGTF